MKCMIKTFGKCGDMRMAFELLDEMQEAGHYLDLYTFTQTLVACNSDKHAGLKHVIEVGNGRFSTLQSYIRLKGQQK